MQRLSNTALAIALTTFISAISLALISSAWFMATYFLNNLPHISVVW